MNGNALDIGVLLAVCVLGGAIHHLVMLCVVGTKAAYAPVGVVIVAIGFSNWMPWTLAACLAFVGHILLEAVSRKHRGARRLRLVVDNTK